MPASEPSSPTPVADRPRPVDGTEMDAFEREFTTQVLDNPEFAGKIRLSCDKRAEIAYQLDVPEHVWDTLPALENLLIFALCATLPTSTTNGKVRDSCVRLRPFNDLASLQCS